MWIGSRRSSGFVILRAPITISIQGHLEPALPVRLPHSPEEEKVNEGTTDLNAANPPSFAAKTP